MKHGTKTELKIIKSALKLFVQKGYHGTSINDITTKVGVTKGALYSHFKSKRDLVFRLFDEFEKQYVDRLIASVTGNSGNAIDKIHLTISFISRYGSENHELVSYYYYIASELSNDPSFKTQLQNIQKKQKDFFEGLFQDGIQEGFLRKDIDPALAGQIFDSATVGMFLNWVTIRSRINGEEFIRAFRKIFFEGIKAEASI